MEVKQDNYLEFEAPVKEFTIDISAVEYTNFDENVPLTEPMINEFEINWQQQVREDSISAIQNPEIASDQVKEISNDDDGSNHKNYELEQESMGFKEIMLERCSVFHGDSQDLLSTIVKRIEDLQLKNWKQSLIKAYFNKIL